MLSADDVLNIDASGPTRDPAEKALRLKLFLLTAERHYARIEALGHKRLAAIWKHAVEKALAGDFQWVFALMTAKTVPVPFEEFATSHEFFGDQMDVWPTLMPSLLEANADVLAGEAPTHESYLGGATGTGKTARAHLTTAYQMYCLSCFQHPQRIWGLTTATPIVFLLQSVSTTITKRVIYKPLRQMFLAMPYAKKHITHNDRVEAQLDLHGNIQLVPALASVQSMVGTAVIGGIFDEINFMSVIDNSKQVPGLAGLGGHFDQANIVHSNVTRRRKSRFAGAGPSFGVLSFISSTRYKGDFLDRRMQEATDNEEAFVQVCRDKQFEVNPKMAGIAERFRFLVGTDTYPPRVLRDEEREGEHYPEGAQVENIPMPYYQDFIRNPEEASRDVIGVASLSITPFISQRHKIIDAIQRGKEAQITNWVAKPDVELDFDGMPQWNEEVLAALPTHIKDRDWHIHVDLSRTQDRCGIAGTSISDMRDAVLGTGDDRYIERMPVFETGFTCSIKPSQMNPIDVPEIRKWLVQLKTRYGINVVSITFDGFDSNESIRILIQTGIYSGVISVDKTMEPYLYMRDAIYSGRLDMHDHEHLRLEMVHLEHLVHKGKVDHPPKGSKDVSDALCGSIFAASKGRNLRGEIGVHTSEGERLSSRSKKSRRRTQRRLHTGDPRVSAPAPDESEDGAQDYSDYGVD